MRLEVVLDQLPPLMNLEEEDVFYYDFRYEFGTRQINLGILKSSNLIFQISSPLARGGYEGMMISHLHMMADPDLEADREVLTTFAREFKTKIQDAYEAFHPKKVPTAKEKAAEIKRFMETFHETIPQETALVKHEAKLLLVGLGGSGKKTLTSRIRELFFDTSQTKLSVNMIRFLLGNLRITNYHLPNHDGVNRDLWEGYFKNKNGLIYVLDAADPETFAEARSWLKQIAAIPQTKELPLLILFNKKDLATSSPTEIKAEIGVTDLQKSHPVKVFPISAMSNEGIPMAINWLAMEVFKRVSQAEKK